MQIIYFHHLNVEKPNENQEGRRKAALQTVAVVTGIITAFLAQPVLPEGIIKPGNSYLGTLALGLLASGSGFWNVWRRHEDL
jgi:hypothetical protein